MLEIHFFSLLFKRCNVVKRNRNYFYIWKGKKIRNENLLTVYFINFIWKLLISKSKLGRSKVEKKNYPKFWLFFLLTCTASGKGEDKEKRGKQQGRNKGKGGVNLKFENFCKQVFQNENPSCRIIWEQIQVLQLITFHF